MGAMMNMDFLLGMPAFDRETYNVCEVLESTAPNVRELQLFKDDAAEMCMGCKSLLIFFPSFKSLPDLGGSVLPSPAFTFSPFHPGLSQIHSSPPGPLDPEWVCVFHCSGCHQ